MQVTINGQQREVLDGMTLVQMVDSLGLIGMPMVAEVNGEIVPREAWGTFVLPSGARIELVRFVGGG